MAVIEDHLAQYPDLEVVEVLEENETEILLGMSDGNVHLYAVDDDEWFIIQFPR